MTKRLGLTLSDDTHTLITERAAAAGQSVHSWLLATVEREAFRQLCDEQARWNAEHTEAVAAAAEDYHRRQQRRAVRDSSAA